MNSADFDAKWTAEADTMRRRGAMVSGPQIIEEVLTDFRAVVSEHRDELLTLAEASRESGYSQDHLSRLVREGAIPDRRPAGTRGRIVLRRGDLPVKPVRKHTGDADVHDLASRLFRGKEGHHGHP